MTNRLWEAVRAADGEDGGGIPVQIGLSPLSGYLRERLGVGALVREHRFLEGGRLFFEKVSGEGPPWGWVTVTRGSKRLLRPQQGEAEAEPAQEAEAAGFVGPPLEVRAANEERGFSYEGYPSWVPLAAAVARLRREGQWYLPPPAGACRCRRGLALAPLKVLAVDDLARASRLDLPGCVFGLPFPHTAAQLDSEDFGPAWLTRAFRAAGTLPEGNEVSRITECRVLPNKGTDTPGAGAMKALITVEYTVHDPELHRELFVKYPYECDYDSPLPFVRYALSSGEDDHDGMEIAVNLALPHLFPFRTPKVYFCDICRETTNWILVQERIPFGERGTWGAGRGPFEVLPACNKYQDFLLPSPAEHYCCLFGKMGQLAAWDKLGRFDGLFGYARPYGREEFEGSLHREQQPVVKIIELQWRAGSAMDKAIDFVLNVASNLVPPEVCDDSKLQRMKEEVMEMSIFLGDFTGCYQFNDTSYIALMHPGLTTDNAFFWRDEYGTMDCGLFDWGAFHRHPFCMWFDRCVNIVDPDLLLEHERSILQSFVDEYHRCGGPELPMDEVVLRFRMAYVQDLLEDCEKVDGMIWERGREALQAITHISDDAFQSHYTTRVFGTMLLSKVAYYVRSGDFKALFDQWCAGAGNRYLTPYA